MYEYEYVYKCMSLLLEILLLHALECRVVLVSVVFDLAATLDCHVGIRRR